jgi:hypothetical protein
MLWGRSVLPECGDSGDKLSNIADSSVLWRPVGGTSIFKGTEASLSVALTPASCVLYPFVLMFERDGREEELSRLLPARGVAISLQSSPEPSLEPGPSQPAVAVAVAVAEAMAVAVAAEVDVEAKGCAEKMLSGCFP